MRRSLVAAAVVLGLVLTTAAQANVIVYLVLPDGGNSTAATPGSTFDLLVRIWTSDSLVSGQMMITDATADHEANPPVFSVEMSPYWTPFNPNDLATPEWSDVEGQQIYPIGVEDLDLASNYTTSDYGALANDDEYGATVPVTGLSDFFVVTVTVSADATFGSRYTLNTTDWVFGNTNYQMVSAEGRPFYVNIVPAPGAFVLGAIGLSIVGWARKRLGSR